MVHVPTNCKTSEQLDPDVQQQRKTLEPGPPFLRAMAAFSFLH